MWIPVDWDVNHPNEIPEAFLPDRLFLGSIPRRGDRVRFNNGARSRASVRYVQWEYTPTGVAKVTIALEV